MRVLFVSSGRLSGSTSPIIRAQGESLKKHNIVVEFFVIAGGILGYFNGLLALRRLLKSNSFDIVHAHYGLCALIALCAHRKERLIVSYMGDDILGSRNKTGRKSRVSMVFAFINRLFPRFFYDFTIVKSNEMAKKLFTSRFAIIPNGVDTAHFIPMDKMNSRIKLGLNPLDKLVIFVSDTTRPEKNYHLAQKSVLNCSNYTITLLPVFGKNHSDLVYYYNAADVLLLTSYHEGSPNVIKEAMACNCPIVSTNVGDVSWLVLGVEGCFISNFSPESFTKKLNLALQFAEYSGKTYGRNRIKFLALDSSEVAKRLVEVYQKVMVNVN